MEGADYSTGQFGQIRMRHVFINGTDPPPGPGQTPTDVAIAKAQTYFLGGAGNLPGDIEFDDGDPWQLHGTIQVPDIFGAATHELGHALGLNHSTDPTAVMYPVFQRFDGPGTGHLGADDIAGVQSIYGAGVGSVTPLVVPEPGSLVLALLCASLVATRRWIALKPRTDISTLGSHGLNGDAAPRARAENRRYFGAGNRRAAGRTIV